MCNMELTHTRNGTNKLISHRVSIQYFLFSAEEQITSTTYIISVPLMYIITDFVYHMYLIYIRFRFTIDLFDILSSVSQTFM